MTYDTIWGLLIEQLRGPGGTFYKFSSPKGEAIVTREERGWAIRGVQRLGRTDARPIVEPQAGIRYDWAKGVPSADWYEPNQPLGPFVEEGWSNYRDARSAAYHRLALMPPRVPYSALDDGTAEAIRDKQFLHDQRVVRERQTGVKVEDLETFYAQIVEMEAPGKKNRNR